MSRMSASSPNVLSHSQPDLPVVKVIPEVLEAVGDNRPVLLKAEPGAGKTTLVPAELLQHQVLAGKKIIVLEPRRLAAKQAAMTLSKNHGSNLGDVIGFRVRHEQKVSASTRLEVVTEGILILMMLEDPELVDVGAVIFDEFHERHLNTDIAFGLALQCRDVFRPDLRLLVMSATLDEAPLLKRMPDAKVIQSEGTSFPLKVEYHKLKNHTAKTTTQGLDLAEMGRWMRQQLPNWEGDVLVFLPGVGEIATLTQELEGRGREVLALHAQLSSEEQHRVMTPSAEPRLILATDIAESSLTLPHVRVVVDGGFRRIAEYDPHLGGSRLKTVRISCDAADQRAGRAGRTGPGLAIRLWSQVEHRGLKRQRVPEIEQADLMRTVLTLAKWGSSWEDFPWVTPPSQGLWRSAEASLEAMGHLKGNGLTDLGERALKLPVSPDRAMLCLKACELGCETTAAALMTWWESRDATAQGLSSLEARVRRWWTSRSSAKKEQREFQSWCRLMSVKASPPRWEALEQLCLEGLPHRLIKRREDGQYESCTKTLFHAGAWEGTSPWLIVFQAKARFQGGCSVQVAIEVTEQVDASADTSFRNSVEVDLESMRLVAFRETLTCGFVVAKDPMPIDKKELDGERLAKAIVDHDYRHCDLSKWKAWCERHQLWARHHGKAPIDLEDVKAGYQAWLKPCCVGLRQASELVSEDVFQSALGTVDPEVVWAVQQEVPEEFKLPSGRQQRIDYSDPEKPVLAAKLQEFFGLNQSPSLLGGAVPLTLHLLSPAGRPAQITQDLPRFWTSSYALVRKDLKGKYPKHDWPEDPKTALPSKGVKRRH
jgi:ATP-dependent helicase HrpB